MNLKAEPPASRAGFRPGAAWHAFAVWLTGTAAGVQLHGRPASHAAALAAIIALGGIAGRALYYAICRRDCGPVLQTLPLVWMGLQARGVSGLTFHDEVTRYAKMVAILTLSWCLADLVFRKPEKCPSRRGVPPVWDSEVNPPSSG